MTWRRISSKLLVRIDRVLLRARQRAERRVAAAEIGAVQLRQVIDVRARVGERAALDQPPLEIDDLAHRRQPLRRLDDLPALAIAKAQLQHVEVQGRIEVVAVGPVAGLAFSIQVTMPPSNSMLSLIGTVSICAIVAVADLVAGVEVDQRAGRGSRPASRIASPPTASRRWCRSPARRVSKPRSALMLAKNRLNRACGDGASAVTTSNGAPSSRLGTRSRLSSRQKPISRSIVRRAAVGLAAALPVRWRGSPSAPRRRMHRSRRSDGGFAPATTSARQGRARAD